MKAFNQEVNCYFILKESTIQKNGFTSSSIIKNEIKSKYNIDVSDSLIRRYLKRHKLKWRRVKKGPYLTIKQQRERLIWCLVHKDFDFSYHVFVDETTLKLFQPPFYHWRLPNKYPKAIPCTNKHKSKINIWGGISYRGPSDFSVRLISMFLFISKNIVLIYFLKDVH